MYINCLVLAHQEHQYTYTTLHTPYKQYAYTYMNYIEIPRYEFTRYIRALILRCNVLLRYVEQNNNTNKTFLIKLNKSGLVELRSCCQQM